MLALWKAIFCLWKLYCLKYRHSSTRYILSHVAERIFCSNSWCGKTMPVLVIYYAISCCISHCSSKFYFSLSAYFVGIGFFLLMIFKNNFGETLDPIRNTFIVFQICLSLLLHTFFCHLLWFALCKVRQSMYIKCCHAFTFWNLLN